MGPCLVWRCPFLIGRGPRRSQGPPARTTGIPRSLSPVWDPACTNCPTAAASHAPGAEDASAPHRPQGPTPAGGQTRPLVLEGSVCHTSSGCRTCCAGMSHVSLLKERAVPPHRSSHVVMVGRKATQEKPQ